MSLKDLIKAVPLRCGGARQTSSACTNPPLLHPLLRHFSDRIQTSVMHLMLNLAPVLTYVHNKSMQKQAAHDFLTGLGLVKKNYAHNPFSTRPLRNMDQRGSLCEFNQTWSRIAVAVLHVWKAGENWQN